jgi:hypothetical protein
MRTRWIVPLAVAAMLGTGAPLDGRGATVRLKDIARIEGLRSTPLIGYGLVVGLNKTGDRRQTLFSAQTLANMLQRFGVVVEGEQIKIENVAAASAACQNILLAAHAQGLGAIWRTGEWARDPKVKEFLGFEADQHLIGFIYVGWPEFTAEFAERPGFEDRTVWME